MYSLNYLWQLMISLTLFYKVSYSSANEGMYSKIEMHGGETNVTVVTADTVDQFLNNGRPVFISFTKDTCRSCVETDYQLVILADNYKKKNINIDIGVLCIKAHGKIAHKYHVHEIPDVRLYYKGMYKRYHYGDDFTLMNRWIEGHLDMRDMIDISNPDKFYSRIRKAKHALIWYGDVFQKLDKRHQELLRRLYFQFSEDFIFFTSDSKSIGETFDLEKHNLYEWNKYDNKFRKVPTEHIFQDKTLSHKNFKKAAYFIKTNSYRKLEKFDPHWIRSHHFASSLIFFIKKNHEHSPLDHENMAIFNKTCIDLMHEKTHCMYYNHEENESFDMDSIFQVPLTHLGDTALVYQRFYNHKREIYVKNITNFQTHKVHDNKVELKLSDKMMEEFHDQAAATPSKIKPYWLMNQKLHPENHKKIIHEFNTEAMYHFLEDHTHDLVVLYHKGNEIASQKSLIHFEKAIKYVLKMASKKPRIRFGTVDCEQNDCHHTLTVAKTFPNFVYYKAWESTKPALLDAQHSGPDGALNIGEMVQLIHFEYMESEREMLKHEKHFKEGEKRVGPGEAHLHEYEKFKEYHEHSLEQHTKSGELHEEAEVPFWPLDKDNMLHHHDNVDFNFNFDL